MRNVARITSIILAAIGAMIDVLQAAAAPTYGLRDLGRDNWKYDLRWEVSSDEVLFGNIAEVVLLADGAVAVADVQLQAVLVFDRDGRMQSRIDVAGSGPGRLSRLGGICADGDDGLMLLQFLPGHVEMVRRDGTPVGSLFRRGSDDSAQGLVGIRQAPGLAVAALLDQSWGEGAETINRFRLAAVDRELQATTTIHDVTFATTARHGVVDETEGYFPLRAWTVIDEHTVALAPNREEYLIEVHDLRTGRTDRLARQVAPVRRSKTEIDRIKAGYVLHENGVRRQMEFRLYDTAEMIQDMTATPAGRLLLATAHRQAESRDGRLRIDLVDPKRRTCAEIEAVLRFDATVDRFFLLPSEDVVVIENGWGSLAADGGDVPAILYWARRRSR